jgi:hypothetical protein
MAGLESATLEPATELDLGAIDPAAITNDILRRALERVRGEAQTELVPSMHHTHHCSHASHSNGFW